MSDIDMTDAVHFLSHTPSHDSYPSSRSFRRFPLSLGKRSRDDHPRIEPTNDNDMSMDQSSSVPHSPTTPVMKKTKRARFASDTASPRSARRSLAEEGFDDEPRWATEHPPSPPPPTPSPSVDSEDGSTLGAFPTLVRPPTPVTHRKASRYLVERPLTLSQGPFPDSNSFSASFPRRNSPPAEPEQTTPTITRSAYFGSSYSSGYQAEGYSEYEENMEGAVEQSPLSSTSSSSWYNYIPNGTSPDQAVDHQDHYFNSGLIAPRPVPAHFPLLDDSSFFPHSSSPLDLSPGEQPPSFYTYSSLSYDLDDASGSSIRPSSTSSSYSTLSSSSAVFSSSEDMEPDEYDENNIIRQHPVYKDDRLHPDVIIHDRKWIQGEWYDPPLLGDLSGYSIGGALERRRQQHSNHDAQMAGTYETW